MTKWKKLLQLSSLLEARWYTGLSLTSRAGKLSEPSGQCLAILRPHHFPNISAASLSCAQQASLPIFGQHFWQQLFIVFRCRTRGFLASCPRFSHAPPKCAWGVINSCSEEAFEAWLSVTGVWWYVFWKCVRPQGCSVCQLVETGL